MPIFQYQQVPLLSGPPPRLLSVSSPGPDLPRLVDRTGPQGKAEASDLLGAIEEKQRPTLDAERAFQEAATREPSDEDYRFDYGNLILQHGKVASAIAVFRPAAADLPGYWKLRVGLGSAY
ncbi:MAG: hypothetical protein ACR2JB_11075 [Bryobacteraceae bacterium]